jgi:hypothetical protein
MTETGSILLAIDSWSVIHYKDQGFPVLSVQGAIYRGERADGISKQRAMTLDELRQLFGHAKMKRNYSDPHQKNEPMN